MFARPKTYKVATQVTLRF